MGRKAGKHYSARYAVYEPLGSRRHKSATTVVVNAGPCRIRCRGLIHAARLNSLLCAGDTVAPITSVTMPTISPRSDCPVTHGVHVPVAVSPLNHAAPALVPSSAMWNSRQLNEEKRMLQIQFQSRPPLNIISRDVAVGNLLCKRDGEAQTAGINVMTEAKVTFSISALAECYLEDDVVVQAIRRRKTRVVNP